MFDNEGVVSQVSEGAKRRRTSMSPSAANKRLRAAIAIRHARQSEALRAYEELPYQTRYHASTKPFVLMQKGNRVGGTLCGMAEIARAATGQDPYGKYPTEGMQITMMGFGESHIARVLYRYLFMPGAFKTIFQEDENRWRAYRPWATDKEINGRFGDGPVDKKLLRPAKPLIPERFCKGGSYDKAIVWDKRNQRIFSRVDLINDNTIWVQNSAGDFAHAQGDQQDLVHIDEDVAQNGWLEEMTGRIVDRGGKLRWTAMPHARTDDIVDLIEKGEDQANNPALPQDTEIIKVSIYDNPFISDEARDISIRQWKQAGDDVYRKRALGELTSAATQIRMYWMFDKETHDLSKGPQDVYNILSRNNFVPPSDWCNYWSFDPGNKVAASTFYTVPPPNVHPYLKVCFAERYIRQCNGKIWKEEHERFLKTLVWQSFIIDSHGANLREQVSGELPRTQYEDMLRDMGVTSDSDGPHFINGSDNIQGREMRTRDALTRDDGYSQLMFVTEQVPETCRELKAFKKMRRRMAGAYVVIDKADRGLGECHAVETVEMACAHGMDYIKPSEKHIVTLVDRDAERARRKLIERRVVTNLARKLSNSTGGVTNLSGF